MTSGIDSEQAWNDFVEKRSFEKATSIQGQLDAITSMLSDIKNDTERVAAQSQTMANVPPAMPPMDGAGAEGMMPPKDGELADVSAGVPPEGSEELTAGGLDESMPPEIPEDAPPMFDAPLEQEDELGGPVDMPPEAEPPAMQDTGIGEPVESDLIGQIKVMIETTQDNEQLKGLANLLSTALSQNQPASPMQGAAMAEETQTSLINKSADKGDDEEEDDEEKKDEPEEKDSEDKSEDADADESEDTIIVSEEPIPEEPEVAPEADLGKDVAEAVADVVEEIVDAALEQPDAVVEMAEEVANPSEDIAPETETFEACDDKPVKEEEPVMKSFADMFAARMRFGVDGQPTIMKNESAFNASGAPVDAPAEDDKVPQNVPTDKQETAEDEDIITAINAESIGKSILPSFEDMMKGKSALNILKADVGQPKDADSLMSEGEMPSGDVSVPKDADSALEDGEMPTGDVSVPKDADSLRKAEPEEPTEDTQKLFSNVQPQLQAEDQQKKIADANTADKFSNAERGSGVVPGWESKQASASDAGIHLKSFAEMYSSRGGFEKSGNMTQTSRPAASAVGGSIERPKMDTVRKSEIESKQPLQIGFGVDAHKAVEADWERYRAWKQSL